MRVWILTLLLSVVCTPLPTGMALAQDARPLRVAVAPLRPPFSFRSETGALTGFDVTLAQAICSELRRPCLITSVLPEQALCRLAAGELDMVVAGLASVRDVTGITLSDPYYRARSVLIAHPGRGGEPIGRIGVQAGGPQHDYLRTLKAPPSILSSTSLVTLWTMLKSGTVDAVLVDNLLSYAFLISPEGRAFDATPPPPPFEHLLCEYRIALPAGKTALRRAVNMALQTFMRNGVHLALGARYFTIDID